MDIARPANEARPASAFHGVSCNGFAAYSAMATGSFTCKWLFWGGWAMSLNTSRVAGGHGSPQLSETLQTGSRVIASRRPDHVHGLHFRPPLRLAQPHTTPGRNRTRHLQLPGGTRLHAPCAEERKGHSEYHLLMVPLGLG